MGPGGSFGSQRRMPNHIERNKGAKVDLPIVRKTPPHRSERCTEAPPAGLLRGIAQFNAGDYWNCHETLEELWRFEPDAIRYLYQGILQLGVGFYHLRRGNYRGAVNKLAGGLAYLGPSAPTCQRIDVERLRREANMVRERLLAAGPLRIAEQTDMELPLVWLVDAQR